MTGRSPYFVALFALLVAFIPVRLCDRTLFSLLNSAHSPATDLIWLALTTMGDGLLMAVILGAFIVKNPRISALGLTLLFASAALVHLLKWLVPEARPAAVIESTHVLGPLLRSGSFPSGHTASGIAAGLAIAYFSESRAAGLAGLALGALIGLSRIFVGAHFPSDVVAGAICGLIAFVAIPRSALEALEAWIPERPEFNGRWFVAGFRLEAFMALVAMCVWAPFAAEVPAVGVAIGLAALVCQARAGKRARDEAIQGPPRES